MADDVHELGDAKVGKKVVNGVQMFSSFVKNLLGPQIRAHPRLMRTKIMIHDDQRNDVAQAVDEILNDTTTNGYVDGVAVHWYGDRNSNPDVLSQTHSKHPSKFILMTEVFFSFKMFFVIIKKL